MQVRQTLSANWVGWNNSWNRVSRACGRSRLKVKHVASVKAPPKPRIVWNSFSGLRTITEPGGGVDAARNLIHSISYHCTMVKSGRTPTRRKNTIVRPRPTHDTITQQVNQWTANKQTRRRKRIKKQRGRFLFLFLFLFLLHQCMSSSIFLSLFPLSLSSLIAPLPFTIHSV